MKSARLVPRVAAVFGSATLSLLAALSVLLVPARARAEQFVLLDVTFTYTKMDADTSTPDKSHYYVRSDRLNASRPTNWTSPVDYRRGVVHVRTEVMDKPAGSENVRWTLCYIPNKGVGAGYGCTNSALYSEEGVFEFEQSMTEWWQNDAIDWTQGIKQMDLVMKDGTSPTGFTHLRPDFEKFFPTTLRITMIQVSAGASYDPSKVPGVPLSDGGAARDGATDGAAIADASDGARASGGATGSGGIGGSGGAGTAGSTGGAGIGGATGVAGAGGVAIGGAGASGAGDGGRGGGGPGAGGATSAGSGGTAPALAPAGDDGGCSLAARRQGGGAGSILLLGLAVIARRRRRLGSRFERQMT